MIDKEHLPHTSKNKPLISDEKLVGVKGDERGGEEVTSLRGTVFVIEERLVWDFGVRMILHCFSLLSKDASAFLTFDASSGVQPRVAVRLKQSPQKKLVPRCLAQSKCFGACCLCHSHRHHQGRGCGPSCDWGNRGRGQGGLLPMAPAKGLGSSQGGLRRSVWPEWQCWSKPSLQVGGLPVRVGVLF